MSNKTIAGSRLIVFDMDGVVTSEVGYWNAARLSVGEILLSNRFFGGEKLRLSPTPLLAQWEPLLSRDLVFTLSRLCVNTNWDRAFVALGLQLLARVRLRPKRDSVGTKKLRAQTLMGMFRQDGNLASLPRTDGLLAAFLKKYPHLTGFDLVQQLGWDLSQETKLSIDQFARSGALWRLCHRVFQEWYCGAKSPRKPGLLAGEEPLIPQKRLLKLLQNLRMAGFILGIATGRPEAELLPLLRRWRVLSLFEARRIVTHDTVARAQRGLKRLGISTPISKPHPFSFAKALTPELTARSAVNSIPKPTLGKRPMIAMIAIVSDTPGDILAAKHLNCASIGIATLIGDRSTASVLKAAGADVVVESVGDLNVELVTLLLQTVVARL